MSMPSEVPNRADSMSWVATALPPNRAPTYPARMRRASCAPEPVWTTAGPTTAIVSLPSSRTRRSRRATSRTIWALGFSLDTAEPMNSNG